ncbi:MAG: hypothetical protein RL514_4181 [Verrucomicrobiota bacterium]|jgi:arylsulfatase A-like enzyme
MKAHIDSGGKCVGRACPQPAARLVVGIWLLTGLLSTSSFAATPRNILLIIADDYGADSSSLYNSTSSGASLPPTPNLAALAQTGVVFRNAYANPVCSPTRAALLTGRHGFRTGVGDAFVGAGTTSLSSAEFTLPRAFAANAALGYQLAQFGKWHLASGVNAPSVVGGWPHYAGNLVGALANYTNWTKTVNGVSTAGTATYATTDLVNDAVTWIQARGTQPWFAWVAFNAPHTPLHKPPNALCPSYTSLPGTTADINSRPRLYFEAMVEAMDTELGRLLAAVDPANTHVIFLGDNGTTASVLQPPYPASRGKDTLYEGGTRVPLVISGPAVVNPGRTNEALVHAVDLFATVLELAGINVVATVPTGTRVDSRSLVPVLSGQAGGGRAVYTELFAATTPGSADGRALRDERFKLIRFADGHDEFFDLQADAAEGTNLLLGALSPTQQQHRDRLEFWLAGYSTNTGPSLVSPVAAVGQFATSLSQTVGASYALWRCDDLVTGFWSPVSGALTGVTNAVVTLTDPSPAASRAFYSVVLTP